MRNVRHTRRQFLSMVASAAVAAAAVARADGSGGGGIFSISADDGNLLFHLNAPSTVGKLHLVAFPVYASPDAPGGGIAVWEGDAVDARSAVRLGRFSSAPGGAKDASADRLFCKFRLFDAATGAPLGTERFVDDLASMPVRAHPMRWPTSIKGVSCPVDVSDLATLGVRHTHVNFDAAGLLRVSEAARDEAFSRVADGQRIYFNPAAVRSADRNLKQLTDAGINVVGVLFNIISPPGPLTHPRTDLKGAPNKMGAFNLTSDDGVRHFRAVVGFLADRYSRGDKPFGLVGGWIIGNEVNSHWDWHNIGAATLETVARQYVDELRFARCAVCAAGVDVPVFASLEHCWGRAQTKNASHHLPGRQLLDAVAGLARAEGDFAWNLAYHPYPQDLFNPRFWKDREALLGFDTPLITFRNIEVLTAYLQRDALRWQGKPRRLIFSEQGFHAGDTSESEQLQAAAYAYAFRRVAALPQIEAFILHRHVDHPHEGGLKLGLWTNPPGARTGTERGRKRPIWDVVRAAETPQWNDATAFALPIVGLSRWEDGLPRAGPIPETAR